MKSVFETIFIPQDSQLKVSNKTQARVCNHKTTRVYGEEKGGLLPSIPSRSGSSGMTLCRPEIMFKTSALLDSELRGKMSELLFELFGKMCVHLRRFEVNRISV